MNSPAPGVAEHLSRHRFRSQKEINKLRPVGQVLGEYGCQLGLEFIGPATMRAGHRYEFINTLDGILELIDRLDLENRLARNRAAEDKGGILVNY
jgi:hypothetical protein